MSVLKSVFIARMSKMSQYLPQQKIINWNIQADGIVPGVYGGLKSEDIAIFILQGKVLISTIQSVSADNMACTDVKEFDITNDQFLQIHSVKPEVISRVKANFKPFVHPVQLNIKKVIGEIYNRAFIGFYIFPDAKAFQEKQALLKDNDRIIIPDSEGIIREAMTYNEKSQTLLPPENDVFFGAKGLTLLQMLAKMKAMAKGKEKTNNADTLTRCIAELEHNNIYKFPTFNAYYNTFFNYKLYGDPSIMNMELIICQGCQVFKISMSPAADEVDQETFDYCLENKVIIMGGTTGAIGTSKVKQHELFRNEMKTGDYFYLCRGNKGIVLIGKITGDWSDFSKEGFRYNNWILRPYEIIATSISQNQQYSNTKKHWTPNFNSTFVRIPPNELDLANKLIFNKYFHKELKFNTSPSRHLSPLNLILYGPPGTGKTYHTVNEALKIIDPVFNLDQDRHLVKQVYDRLVKEGRIVFTTFHQSMSYEDFVEGIKPVTLETQKLGYEIEPGLFKQLAGLAMDNWLSAQTADKEQLSFDIAFTRLQEEWEEKPEMKFSMKRAGNDFTILGFNKTSIRFKKASGGTNHTLSIATLAEYYYKKREIEPSGLGIYYPGILEKLNSYKPSSFVEKYVKPFVLIIDEINRGNVSQIFGELITLIEPDKRAGMEEALEAVLPYSKEKFSVPPNLFIIGTMNTADRSVEALDTALRRRFTFKEMMPDVSVQGMGQIIGGISLTALLNTLNRRIELLLDRDHQIGHSFLMKVKDLNGLMQVFYHQIIPLLKEYFYGDFGKIGLVLEDGFVTADSGRRVFGKFNYDDRNLLEEKKRYSITDYSAGHTPDIEGFKDALLKLLNGNTGE